MAEVKRKPINILVGGNIKKYREQFGYSREKLAEKLDISPRFLANIEIETVGPSLTTVKKACEVLGVSADRLLWEGDAVLGLDERVKHLPQEYVDYLHQIMMIEIEMIERRIGYEE